MRIPLLTAAGLIAAALSPPAYRPSPSRLLLPFQPQLLRPQQLRLRPSMRQFGPGRYSRLGQALPTARAGGGYSGLTLPLVLGAEQQLAPGWSATLNGSSLWNIGQQRSLGSSTREGLNLRQLGVDVGIRHYYNQEKRQAKNRRTGPYQGPYVALQLNNYFRRDLSHNHNYSRHSLSYDYSTLTARWGMQRRLGGRGLLDAYLGGGVANPRHYRYYGGLTNEYKRDLSLGLELGVKLSLTNK